MIDGIPNRPLYFYQKDIIVMHDTAEEWYDTEPTEATEPS